LVDPTWCLKPDPQKGCTDPDDPALGGRPSIEIEPGGSYKYRQAFSVKNSNENTGLLVFTGTGRDEGNRNAFFSNKEIAETGKK
jgi:alanine-alpha-ketoisovalerate/valine-pyruvate aminotransferase